jgi:hypothetical protein
MILWTWTTIVAGMLMRRLWMSAQPEWQFVGNVPENYERYLVPSIFGPWAKDLVEVA